MSTVSTLCIKLSVCAAVQLQISANPLICLSWKWIAFLFFTTTILLIVFCYKKKRRALRKGQFSRINKQQTTGIAKLLSRVMKEQNPF